MRKPGDKVHNANFVNDPKFKKINFPGLQKVNCVMEAAFKILKHSPSTENLFYRPPSVVFKRPQN